LEYGADVAPYKLAGGTQPGATPATSATPTVVVVEVVAVVAAVSTALGLVERLSSAAVGLRGGVKLRLFSSIRANVSFAAVEGIRPAYVAPPPQSAQNHRPNETNKPKKANKQTEQKGQ
jgi:hypothetical protein